MAWGSILGQSPRMTSSRTMSCAMALTSHVIDFHRLQSIVSPVYVLQCRFEALMTNER